MVGYDRGYGFAVRTLLLAAQPDAPQHARAMVVAEGGSGCKRWKTGGLTGTNTAT
jgi:hypothetical protein